ncbi:peptidylprolyl isomerase [Sphingomonas montanisoli]|uniref:Peptidyl-prolyl cis-trans isomerase n=1 Tax=Sphingomonas montanisoli TaxID=2606412 RepID=A0A5D9C088_9SPHN|nr:peptidylprolyl isomerase [Sphingomonas montanisoli]TZG25066.1 peptidylprolyl isomerase [Sphingomonas montanisoli]
MSSKFVTALLAGLLVAGSASAQVIAPSPVVPPVTPQNVLVLNLSVGGPVRIQLRPDVAPGSVERIKTLVRRKFYDGLAFHRVIEGFMAQGGDPKGTGEGGSDLPDLKAEFNDLPHVRGVVSLARTNEPNTANSQFFIMLQPNLGLDHNYTAIGRVIEGMQYADAIEKGEPPVNPTKIVHASIESDDLGQPAETPESAAASKPPEAPVAAKLSKKERREMERNIEANKTSDAVRQMSKPGGQ